MLGLKSLFIVLVVGLVAGGLSSWHFTSKYKDSKHKAAVAESDKLAAEKLTEVTNKAVEIERAHNELATKLEINHEHSQRALDQALVDNQRLARELGGLRDPGRKQNCSSNTMSATPKPTVDSYDETSGAYLSTEATEFLLGFAREADRAAEYAQTCESWVRQLNVPGTGSNHVRTEFRM